MLSGEWSEELNAFWFGASGREWIAWKGSHQIYSFRTEDYPNPPNQVIQHHKRIETLEDFNKALKRGRVYKVSYEEIKPYWED